MTLHFPSLFSSAHGKLNPQACTSFSIRSAPWDGEKFLIHPLGAPIEAQPMYTITLPSNSISNVILSRGWGIDPRDIIGDARLPTFSSKIHMNVYGQSTEIRFNEISGSATLETPSMGKLKWKLDSITMKNLELRDSSSTKLAKFRSGKALGEKVLDILVPHDIRFLELAVLSGMTTRKLNKTAVEATGEILSSVLGA